MVTAHRIMVSDVFRSNVTNDEKDFTEIHTLEKPVTICIAKTGQTMSATKFGTITVISDKNCEIEMKDVLFVRELRRKLLSVRKIDRAGYSVVFGDNKVEIRDRNGNCLASGTVSDELYKFEFRVKKVAETACLVESSDSLNMWHKRLSHLNHRDVLKLDSLGHISVIGERKQSNL